MRTQSTYEEKASPKPCNDHDPKTCGDNNFKRVRYFHGMLMGDRDFNEEQNYHIEKRKLHNRMLHGWGVVCGLWMSPWDENGSGFIKITEGMALDCEGNEIVVLDEIKVDVRKLEQNHKEKDPEKCKSVSSDGKCIRYVVISYRQTNTDPVPVYISSSGCGEKNCDYSRIQEGFCIDLFEKPPCQPPQLIHKKYPYCEEYICPKCYCRCDSYVVLGTIDLGKGCIGNNIKKEDIDNCVRQNVESFAIRQPSFLDPAFWVPKISSEELYHEISELKDKKYEKFHNVVGKSNADAENDLGKQYYNSSIQLAPENYWTTMSRVSTIGTMPTDAKVDLVTDQNDKVLFFLPAIPSIEHVQEKMEQMLSQMSELSKANKELTIQIDDLRNKIEPKKPK